MVCSLLEENVMDGATFGILGGTIGSALGILGGVAGSYFSNKNTKGPNEKRFMVKMTVYAWSFLIILGLIAYLLPGPYKVFAFFPLWIALPFFIRYCNKKQQEIRLEESSIVH
jgi:hypothetical protein